MSGTGVIVNAKILLYDLETSPIVSYNWGIYEQNAIEIIQDWQILCFSYKWLGEKKVRNVAQWDFKGHKPGVDMLNDYKVVLALRELFNEADVVIAHNGDSFDQKKSQARMMVHGIDPPSPYRQIDTKKVARKYGNHTSNKLDHLNKSFGIGKKMDVGGFSTWKGCMEGDRKAQKRMVKYNNIDVLELEKLYLHMRGWIQNHPSVNIMEGELSGCPKCGSTNWEARNSPYPTKTGYKQPVWCFKCKGWSNVRTTINLRPELTN